MILIKLFILFKVIHMDVCTRQPNIVFILGDDLGYKDLGFQKSDIRTPNIDELAKGGIILTNHYALHSCAPSRAALLTGRYPTKTGMYNNFDDSSPVGIPLNFTLLPQLMNDLNYSTHLVGKWHAGFFKKKYWPTHRGFDTFFGIPMKTADKYTHTRCFPGGKSGCGYALYNQTQIANENYIGIHSTTLFFKRAIKLVKYHVKHSNPKPLFLMVTTTAPHFGLQAPNRYILANKHIKSKRRRKFAGMVTHMDHWVGRLRKVLGELNLWENTILVFASDNGPAGPVSSSKPLRGGKKEYYEGGIRSISFIASPLLQRKRLRVNSLMHLTDWLPTFTKLGGALQSDLDLDGYDMWDVLNQGGFENPRKQILHGFDMPESNITWLNGDRTFVCDSNIKGALRIGNWKLLTGLEGNGRRYSLYNIAKDKSEKKDISLAKPKKLAKMCKIMQEHYRNAVPRLYEPPDPKANPTLHGNKWTYWLEDE